MEGQLLMEYSDDGRYCVTAIHFQQAAIVELNDGSLYYNFRRHYYNDGNNRRMRLNCLALMEDSHIVMTDGPKNLDYGLMAGA